MVTSHFVPYGTFITSIFVGTQVPEGSGGGQADDGCGEDGGADPGVRAGQGAAPH